MRTLIKLLCALCLFTASARATVPGTPGTNYLWLDYWDFADTTNWTTYLWYSPISFTNLSYSTLGNGKALVVDSTNAAWLNYNVYETNGWTNLTVDQGSFTVWFAPYWSSTNQGGTGPGTWGRIIEAGSYTTNASVGWWSLYLDPAGANLIFSAQTNNGVGTNYLVAPISWTTNRWHLLALTYSSTNTLLYIDGLLVTNGPGMTVWPGTNVLTNGFFIGSDATGVSQACGMFDDLFTYSYVLDSNAVYTAYLLDTIFYDLNPLNFANLISAPAAESGLEFDAITGAGYLQAVSTNAYGCITNSSVWITNVTAQFAPDGSTAVTFTIAGGSNGVPYDVFATTALTGSYPSNSTWAWMGQGYQCVTYTLTNMPATACFLILGTPQDSDNDGLTDAYELLVSKTDPHNPDTAYTGLSDGWAVIYGLNPLLPTNVPCLRLGYWRFNTNTWIGEQGQLPVTVSNITSVPSWSGTAVLLSNASPSILKYRDREVWANDNINLSDGSVRLWVQPGWDSGTGPGSWASLIEVGPSSGELWSLRISPAGDTLELLTQAGAVTTTNASATLPSDTWTNGSWHQIVCTYGPTNDVALYLDGVLSVTGTFQLPTSPLDF